MSIQLQQSFTVITCANCGVAFAVPDAFYHGRLMSGVGFFCPNGHTLSYHETTVDKLRKQLEENQRQLNAKQLLIDQSRNREQITAQALQRVESAKKRLEKRVANGVCPVPGCKRHFTDLNRHMKTQHKGVVSLPESPQRAIAG